MLRIKCGGKIPPERKAANRLVSVNNKYASTDLVINNSVLMDGPENLMGSENKEVLVVLRNEKGLESYSKLSLIKIIM